LILPHLQLENDTERNFLLFVKNLRCFFYLQAQQTCIKSKRGIRVNGSQVLDLVTFYRCDLNSIVTDNAITVNVSHPFDAL